MGHTSLHQLVCPIPILLTFLLAPLSPVYYLANLPPRSIISRPERMIIIAIDNPSWVRRLYILIETAVNRHIRKCRLRWVHQRPSRCNRHDLRYLPARHIIARAERPIRIPRHDPRVCSSLYKLIERTAHRHINKRRRRRTIKSHSKTKDYDLRHLASCGEIVRPERIIPVPWNYPLAIQEPYRLIKVISRHHIRKRHCTGRCR